MSDNETTTPEGAFSSPELEQITAELQAVQETLRDLAARRVDVLRDKRRRAELRAIEAEMASVRARRDALQDRRLVLLQEERGATAENPDPHRKEDGGQGARPAPAGSRGYRPAASPSRPSLLRSLGVALSVALLTVVVLGGFLYLLGTWLLVPPPIAGTATVSESAEPSGAPVSFEERLIGFYLALNRDQIEAPAGDDPTPVLFTVEPGETAATIAASLEEVGLIRDAQLFRWLLRYRGVDQTLEAGTFELNQTMTMDEIILALQEGRLEETTVTIPEGWRAEQIAEFLESQGLFSAADYLAVVRDPGRFDYEFLEGLPPNATLEGFLFPDTYRVVKEQVTPESFVRLQLDTFGQRLSPELRRAARDRQITIYQAVTLASIVEREAVVAEERPLIAGVFLNRWRDGMLLNADPTVQYALGRQDGEWWKRPLLLEDLQVDSPYNTYKVVGLPPGPICNPGLDALRATIEAPPTDYYYFVARGDGSGTHVFAETFEEHQQNVAREQGGG